MESRDATFF
jgi:hypothetical protein